jgi:small conductance mechanosensitive channel
MNTEAIWTFISTQGVDLGLKILAALAAWIAGRWLIGWVVRLLVAGFRRGSKIDQTLANYLTSIISVLLNIVLVVAILDMFGVKTTSFAALLAGAGLAIGTAWGGLLTHFAAGVFMQVLRPYKVGDVVQAGGITGTVKELGLFGTTIITGDNVVTIIGNNKVFSDTIHNYSVLPSRRVDCTAKLAHSVDVKNAIERLRVAVVAIPNVVAVPAPEIEILEFTPEGPLLALRPYAHTDHYWQVYFDVHKAVVATFGAAGYPVPERPTVVRQAPANP